MKLAILVPQRGHTERLLPPLELAYLAAQLERSHIVRIYDLALSPGELIGEMLAAVQRFAPDLLALQLSSDISLPESDILNSRLGTCAPLALIYTPDMAQVAFTLLTNNLCDYTVAAGYEQALIDLMPKLSDPNLVLTQPGLNSITRLEPYNWPPVASIDLDQLPFPARHLLQLERYGLRAVDGQLQTTVMIGTPDPNRASRVRLRNPSHVVLEMRSIARELGIRHYLLLDIPVTHDLVWLRAFCQELSDVEPRIFWEGCARTEQITDEVIVQMSRSGCEAIWYQFDLMNMLASGQLRNEFCARISSTKAAGIYTRALLDLQPPYDRLPKLIDMTATFGIEDVHFKAEPVAPQPDPTPSDEKRKIENEAKQRYEAKKGEQDMIDRFGRLGPMIWRLIGKNT